ncbi:hypothetical protein [Endozoicomonas lisbonensis]|uniref:hypothetical protein n=1 Tax=Endozoicomonas lisbonensis TaxID=3120522 RepID=UPI003397559E
MANEQKFNTSWPNLILPVQREFIKCAAGYGFVLRPKVLNLQRLENKTKYKTTSDKNRTGSVFSSLSLDKEVSVLDLRVNKTVTTGQIIDKLNAFLQKSMIEASFRVIVGFDENNLDDLSLDRNDQLLILLDQRPKVPGDRYPLTSVFKGKVASQHLNVNPYDLTDEDELENLSLGTEEKPSPAYYLYDFDDFDREGVESNLKRNAEVVIKELHLKHLIISPKARISKSLSNEKELLTEHLTVITDGYLFTVRNDRPVILPFNPSDKSALNLCDSVLKNHRISSIGLLALLKDKWPYSYRPEVVMQQFGTPSEKQTRFAKRLTFVLLGESTILLQDPKYDRPHMLPEGMEEVTQTLRQQGAKLPLQEWKLPTLNEIIKRIDLLTKNKEFTAENQKKLNASLGDLTNFWEEGRQQLADDEKYEARLKDMVNAFNNSYKKHLRRELGLSDDQHPRGDTQLRSLWMTLLSALYKRSMTDPRRWLRDVPGINAIWHDPEQSYYVVGQLASAQKKLSRQPSIRQWHALKGQVDTELLASLIDVDWVRMNQLAGNPCVATLIRKWQECQPEPGAALIPQKNKPLSVTDLKEEYSVSI